MQNGRQRKGEGWDASCLSSRPITHSISYPFTLRTRYRKEISTEVPFIVPTSYSEYTAFLKTKSKILRCVVRVSYYLCAVHCLNILFAAINIHLFIYIFKRKYKDWPRDKLSFFYFLSCGNPILPPFSASHSAQRYRIILYLEGCLISATPSVNLAHFLSALPS